MKINITKKQYWELLRATYMADWMANSICEQDMEQDKGIKDIRNFIFSFAKDFGYEEFVTFDKDTKTYYSTWDLDDEPKIRELIKRYDEHTFWEEAMEMFAERDVHEKYTYDDLEKMDHEERVGKIWEAEDRWSKEFEEYGIKRLRVVDMKMESRSAD